MRPLMIFGAGFGTRMGALTADRPKPLIEVAGVSLLDRALRIGAEAGHGPIVVNTHYLGHQIEAHLEDRDVRIAREEERILDTGGGLRAALPLLGEGPVATLNPDCVWSGPNPLSLLEGAWDGERMSALMLVVPLDRTRAYLGAGDFRLGSDGRLVRTGPFVYSGAQILDPAGLVDIPHDVFSLNRYWNTLAAEGRLFGLPYPGLWCDVGHPEGIGAAEALLRERGDV
jgi:MurNAc alpha-1-phosphate uridylyltransferase